ncbi:DgyrCDS8834 [Dimorphilus gyrociliatus]|uniref:Vacuolar protein-sorting-associated protein 36 n=1 Tax=Dimorphilus gyrociliatus TaxID=2664684 RepID=A0A7I8W0H8_9ANNE|nr:DgyrCDS8834 [Dimorphilus gyrociliatus]
MNRFTWSDGFFGQDETLVTQQSAIRIYDGEDKSSFDNGRLLLTTHQLIWRDSKNPSYVIALHLSKIVFCEEESSRAKIILHLSETESGHSQGPSATSKYNFIKFSFKSGGQIDFYRCLNDTLQRKLWKVVAKPKKSSILEGKAVGIGGIERSMQKQRAATDKTISAAFQDLDGLIVKAKDMVEISKSISRKIKDQKGEISEDETVRFKSYLLSLGISDPVTRETHGTGLKYYRELAREVSKAIEKPLRESGGVMTMTDAYCRINRARGIELLSPEDLINGCQQLEALKLPVRMEIFESGVIVLKLHSLMEENLIEETYDFVSKKKCLSAEELAGILKISIVLAKERLLQAEKKGKLCRDDSLEGLIFFPNYFLITPTNLDFNRT